ncbi:hypothetical protein E2I00_002031, partial [Balaenoptera physalus]
GTGEGLIKTACAAALLAYLGGERRGPTSQRAYDPYPDPGSIIYPLPNRIQSRSLYFTARPSPKSGQADGASEDSLHLDIQKLKEKKDMLDKEISQLISEGYSVDELEDHISQLHEYNDIKDVGQMLLGKLGEGVPMPQG